MRKTLLILTVLIVAYCANAQQNENSWIFKGVESTIIWQTDFNADDWSGTSNEGVPVPENAPEGWSIVDNTGNNFNWRWSLTGPRGHYTSPGDDCNEPDEALNSTTADNGFLIFEADHFNTSSDCTEWTEVQMDAYLQYSTGIDFSEYTNVSMVVEQWHRFCCDPGFAYFSVSVDGGTTWTETNMWTNIGSGAPNGTVTELDISDLVAGESNVMFRFHLYNVSHHHWAIDDLKFVAPDESSINEDSFEAFSFEAYPSPSNGVVTVKSENISGQLNVIRVNGQVIVRSPFKDALTVDLTKFGSGVYYVNLESDGFRQTKKIIIK